MKAIWAAALLALVGGSVADAAAPQRAATHKTVKSKAAKHRKARRPRRNASTRRHRPRPCAKPCR